MDPYIGKLLDNRYEILERIGTGGMAVVYKAKCHRLNRLVAVKILKADLAQDEDFRRRFNAESQAVAQLSHPNIVSVYDVSRGGDTEYIVMELIDGITLKQYMEKRGQLNWRESLHFITQIMRGLSHAHSRGIVHRDIKPQNIMVLRDGSVRVADFGIACLENSAQTLTQEAFGSVHYISPEQARGDRIDARSDIYSAGVVLYEMLTGRLPFEGDSAVSVAIQHLSSIPLAPREINPDIPEQLELICMKAMMADIDRRYASADAMIADLEAFRKNPGVNLDFELSDLRPEISDEPTQLLHTTSGTHITSSITAKQQRIHEDYDDPVPKKSGKKHTALFAAVGILAVVVAVVLLRSILSSFEGNHVEQYVVKSVLGMTVEEARELEGVEGIFNIKVVGEVPSDKYEKDMIVKQKPAPDEHRKGENLEIEVWISSGAESGVMPNVVNMSAAQAEAELKDLVEKYDLTVKAREEDEKYDDQITKGYIISSVPAKGETLQKGDTIYLVISKGPELGDVVVPDFLGKDIDTVRKQLSTWKLTCTDVDIEMVDSDAPGGEIIWQSLEATTTVKEWDTIQFKVSSGLSASIIEERIPLPQDGRESVHVEVYVGNEKTPQYSENLSCADEYAEKVQLTGTGTQQMKVYFDGLLAQELTKYLQFS